MTAYLRVRYRACRRPTVTAYTYVLGIAPAGARQWQRLPTCNRYSACRRPTVNCMSIAPVWSFAFIMARYYGQRLRSGLIMGHFVDFRDLQGQMARWLQVIAECDFKTVHRSGRSLTNVSCEGEGSDKLSSVRVSGSSRSQQSLINK